MQAAVSRHSIMRQEQYCYPTPLPNIVATLADVNLLGLSERSLLNAYHDEVTANRIIHGRVIASNRGWIPLDYVSHRGKHHAFTSWRRILCVANDLPTSAIQFSQMFSIHPATLTKYESFKTRFPHPIEVALNEAGCPADLLDSFRTHHDFNIVTD